jgi:hypothetical protein
MARLSRHPLPSASADPAELTRLVREHSLGRLNVAGVVTLESGTTTTTIIDREFGVSTVLSLTPRSAAAAAIVPYQTANAKGSITIGHAAPGADVAFYYSAIG